MTSTDKLAREIQRLKTQLVALSTTPRLASSSIENGSVDAYDAEGNLVMEIGQQFDGTYVAASLSGPRPSAATAPVLTASQMSLTAAWDGVFVNAFGVPDVLAFAPQDFSRLEVHVSTVKGFDPLTSDTLRATIETPRGADVVVGPLPAVPHFVRFVVRSLSGKASLSSAEAEITPLPAVDRAAFDAKMGQLDRAIADTNLLLDESSGELASATQRLGAAEDDLDTAFGRLSTAENTLGAVPTQISAANTATLASAATTAQTKADTAQAAAITAAATDAAAKADLAVEKSIAAGGYQLNPSFDDWGAGSFPAGWAGWVTGSNPIRDTATARRGKYAMRFSGPDTTSQRGSQISGALAHMPNLEYVTVEVEFSLASGALSGAGVLVDWTGLLPATIRQTISLAAEVPAPVFGRVYRVVKTLKRPTSTGGTFTGMSGYLMGNWSTFGGAAKDISYDWMNVRPATTEEITAFNAPADAQAKATAAQVAAALDATTKANAARDDAMAVARAAAGLAGIKGTVWTQPDTPKSGVSYRYTGGRHTSLNQQLLDGVVQRTNRFYNPAMEGSSGTLDVYRNLGTDPRCTVAGRSMAIGRWFGSGQTGTYSFGVPVTGHPLGITTGAQKTWTTGPAGTGDTGFNSASFPVTAGVYYSASADLKHDSLQPKALAGRIFWRDSSGGTISQTTYLAKTVSAGEWSRVSNGGIAPTGAVTAQFMADVVNGNPWVAGESLWVTGFMAGAFDVHVPYFDGEISADPDFTPVWVSGANNSTSIARAPTVTGITSQRAAVIQVVRAGKKVARVIPVTSGYNSHGPYVGGDVFADLGPGMDRVVEAGKTYTISATLEFERMPVTNGGARFRLSFPGGERNVGVVPAAVGRVPLAQTWVAPTSGVGGFMRIAPHPPADAARNDFLIHDLMFVEGTQVTPLIHGDLPDDRAGDLWIDTDEKNQPKRWDPATDGWISVTDQSAIDAATALAALDATAKADAARAAAITAAATDATAKADAAQAAAVTAAAADAKLQSEAAESRAAATAALDAKAKADAAQAAALAAAKTYADAQASGASGAALDAAKADATAKADAAQAAAISAAALDATAKKEAAEVVAAADAKAKADAALAAAKTDATTKANAAQATAITAAATDAQAKATAAQTAATNAATTAAAADATAKADAARAAATTAAAADAKAKADAAQAAAITSATADAQSKANAAQAAATTAAAADAKAKADAAQSAATAAAAADAKTKADAALAAAKTDATTKADAALAAAKTDATTKANAAQAAATTAAAADAKTKADAAQAAATTAATTAAAADATAKADAARAAATTAAAADAKTKADAAQAAAITSATADAKAKADAAQAAATTAAATDAKAKADAAQSAAIAAAATDAKTKADAALASAQADATSKANAAQAAAVAAAKTETTSQVTTVNNSILGQNYYGTAVPTASSPAGARIGSTYRRKDASNVIIGEYEWTGATNGWVQRKLSGASLTALDVGTLSAGTAVVDTAVAQKLAAAQASFTQADIGNLTVTGTTNLATAVAERIAANTGSFISLAVSQLTAGTGTMAVGVIDKLYTDVVMSRKITAEQLDANAINGKTITGGTFQTGTEQRSCIMLDSFTNSLRMWDATGKQTLLMSGVDGSFSAQGTFTSGAPGRTVSMKESDRFGRPVLEFDGGGTWAYKAGITTAGTDEPTPSYDQGSMILHSAETTSNETGRAELTLKPGGNFYLASAYGPSQGTILSGVDGKVLLGAADTMILQAETSGQFITKASASVVGGTIALLRSKAGTAWVQSENGNVLLEGGTPTKRSNVYVRENDVYMQTDEVIATKDLRVYGNLKGGAGYAAYSTTNTALNASVWGPAQPALTYTGTAANTFCRWQANDVLLITVAGYYTITHSISITGAAATGRSFVDLGISHEPFAARASLGIGEDSGHVSTTVYMPANSTVRFGFYQTTGASRSVRSIGRIMQHRIV